MVLNYKEFCIFFRYQAIFAWLKTSGYTAHAVQNKIHKGFVQMGLRLAKSTENLMQDGYE